MNNAVIYARYSSAQQSEESIEAQVRACKDYAAAKGYNVIEVYADEAVSGKGSKTASRVQYQKLLRDCRKGAFETILIHKYDRIARNVGEHVNLTAKLQEMGVELIAVAQDFGNSNEAKIMRTLMWSLSEYYIDNLASETRKGLKETALKGLHNGGYAPFGYDVVNQQYVINELEAQFVKKIFNAALERKGFKDIIQELAECGITGKRGKPIKYTQIYEMLRNEKYTGVYVYSPEQEKNRADRRTKPNAIRIENALPIIISKAQFEEVQKIMNERRQTGKKAGYLCSGLVYCECGAKMHGMKSERKGHTYHYFYCSKKCGAPSVRMESVDKSALDYLKTLLSDENQSRIAKALREYKGLEKERTADFKTILESRIEEKQKRYNTLMQNLSSGVLPAEVVTDIGAEMKAIKDEIASLRATEPPKDYTVEQIKAWLEAIKNSPDEAAVHLLIKRIDIKNKTEFNIQSTLNTVLGDVCCEGTHHILPEILFRYFFAEQP